MKRALRIIVILGLAIGISVAGYMSFADGRPPKAPDYRIVPIERDTIVAKVSTSGSITPIRQVALSFKGSGRVVEVPVEIGQTVQEGQLLGRLESRDLDLALQRARSALEISKSQLAQVEAGPTAGDWAAAQASLASAQAAYERTARGASAEDIASAQASLASAQASLRKLREGPAEQEVTVAKANLEQARIALEQAQSAYDKVSWVGAVGALPQSLQLQQATISYEAAQANFELATRGPTESQLKAGEAQVAQSQAALDRLLESPTESDLAVAQAQVAQAQAGVDRLKDNPTEEQLAIAREQVRQAEIAVEQAEWALEGTRLIAPFAGIIGQVNIEVDVTAPLGQPAVVLVDLSEYYVDVSIDEIDVPQVHPGQEATITLDALPDVAVPGRVQRIAPVSTTVGGAVSYIVRVTIQAQEPALKPGMTANIDVITARHVNVLTASNRAIRVDRTTGVASVERLVDQLPVETEVQLGLRGDQVSEVVSGLSDGDQVIVRGVSSLERLVSSMGGF